MPDYDLDGLEQTTILQGELLVAVPAEHRFAGRTDVTVEELAREPWIAAGGSAAEPQFGAWPTLSGPRIAHIARSWSTRLGLVAAGLGLTVVPDLTLAALPAGVRTVAVLDGRWHGRATVAVTRIAPSAQARSLVTALNDCAAV